MKKILFIGLLLCGGMSMSSCLNFDEPGDELEMNERLYKYNPSSNDFDEGDSDEEEGDDPMDIE